MIKIKSFLMLTIIIVVNTTSYAEDYNNNVKDILSHSDIKGEEEEMGDTCGEIVTPENFFYTGNTGWFAYDDFKKCLKRKEDKKKLKEEREVETVKKEESLKDNINEPLNIPPKDYYEIAITTTNLKEFQEAMDHVRVKAIFFPNEENIKNYIAVQYRAFELSQAFSNSWRQVILKYPEYDYESKVSTSIMGTRIKSNISKEKMEQKIESISKRAGLYFFYNGSDMYSIEQAKVLKYLQSKYNIYVHGITLDTIIVSEYPDSVYKPEAAQKMGVANVPSIYLFFSDNNSYVLVSPFFSPIDILEKRLYEVASINDNENPYDSTDKPVVSISKQLTTPSK
jgi:hypothetical protein